ncbi:uncharacterized protein LOC144709068 [Wolffia australiana]
MASTLTTLNDKIEETQVVEKIIRSVPQRFRQIVVAITTLLDVSKLTIADLTSRLKAAEDAFEETPLAMHHEGKLYLTEEEWDAQRKKHDVENKHGGRAAAMQHAVANVGMDPTMAAKRGRREGARQATQGGPMMRAENAGSWAIGLAEEKRPDGPTKIQLWEEVFAHLGDEEQRDEEMWVLDTGATNHMSGSRMAFAELDAAVLGSIRVSQLDEVGYQVDIKKGAMKIHEPGGRLLAKVMRRENRLYILHIKLIRAVCLEAKFDEEA